MCMVEQSPDKKILQWTRYTTGPASIPYLVEKTDRDPETVEESCHRLRESRFLNQHLPQDAWTITKKGTDWLDRNGEVLVRTYQCTSCRREPEFETGEADPARFCPWCGKHTIETTGVRFQ